MLSPFARFLSKTSPMPAEMNGNGVSSESGAQATSAAALATKGSKNKRMSVERIYQKKSQLEHILLRPDTYIGKWIETLELNEWDQNT
jgi:hypothetical protein